MSLNDTPYACKPCGRYLLPNKTRCSHPYRREHQDAVVAVPSHSSLHRAYILRNTVRILTSNFVELNVLCFQLMQQIGEDIIIALQLQTAVRVGEQGISA